MEKKPPLQLDRYFFPEVAVKAVPNFKPDDNQPKVWAGVEGALIVLPGHARHYAVQLTVQVPNNGESPPPYEVDIQAFGLFTVEDDIPEDHWLGVVAANGPGLLYGAVRELALNITGRGPWGPMQLPLVVPSEMVEKLEIVDAAQRTPVPVKKVARRKKKAARPAADHKRKPTTPSISRKKKTTKS